MIRRDHLLGRLDATAAAQAVGDLRDWPGERYPHQPLLSRVWELRGTVRAWVAFYVALAEALDATLVTAGTRLAAASGPRCAIEVVVGRHPDVFAGRRRGGRRPVVESPGCS